MDMRNIVVLVFLLIFVIPGRAQETEERQIGTFHGVRASEAIDVYLKKGDKESVKVQATGIAVSNVITEVYGSYLKVHMRSGNFPR